jgi:hypothetical protein
MRRWTILNVLLAVIVGLLGIEIVRTWARSVPSVDLTPRQPAPAREAEKHAKGKRGATDKTAGRVEQSPAVMVAAVADKDLFDPSRRGTTEDAASPVAHETGPPAGISVVGIRILGKDREVFVTDASQGNQQRRLRPGDQVGGYTVKTIEPTGLVLVSPSGDAVNMELSLEKGKPQPAHPAAVPGKPAIPVQAAAKPSLSPAAGAQGTSPAAGLPVKPAVPVAPTPGATAVPGQGMPATTLGKPAGGAPGQNTQLQKLPGDVRQKLEQLKEREQGSRLGRKQR